MSNLPDSEKTLQEQCYGTCWGAEQRIMELEYHIHKLVTRLEAADKLRAAMQDIANLEGAPSIDVSGDLRFGLHCGVEDRDCTDRYESADFGWSQGVERTLEWATLEAAHALAAFDAAGKETLCP